MLHCNLQINGKQHEALDEKIMAKLTDQRNFIETEMHESRVNRKIKSHT